MKTFKKKNATEVRPSGAVQGHASDAALTPESWLALLLGLMMAMAPAMGVPTQEMLQDTLKSIVVAHMALVAALVFFWQRRKIPSSFVWHKLMWLPLMLASYGLASMAWSHTYLAGVEAARWFVFSLVLWLGMNCSLHGIDTRVLRGIHWGISIASAWAVLQFWLEFDLFPQGPNPASTFVNRNFFAEYAICALPFSVYLLTRAKPDRGGMWLAATTGLNLVALMMTGTRSALLACGIFMLILPVILLRWRQQFACFRWNTRQVATIAAMLLVTLIGLGSVATANDKLLAEFGPASPIERATNRALSLAKPEEYRTGSFSVRAVMWQATQRMIASHPVTGVGAGAWEVQVPRFQNDDMLVEADYYAHNEVLQLLAEYGLTGWLFLCLLIAYLLFATWKTWTDQTQTGRQHAPLRAAALASLLMLLIVSNAGFPWRMASTSALFALALGFLAASDIELGYGKKFLATFGRWTPHRAWWAMGAGALGLVLASYLAQRATLSERALVQSVKLALTISKSGQPNHPYWDEAKREMLVLVKEGIALNPHYRKLTPMVADELASWGDWTNALWIWRSVLDSRPNVVAILTNMARAQLATGDLKSAQINLEKAQHLQPEALAVKTLRIMVLSHNGEHAQANEEVGTLLAQGVVDYNFFYTAYFVAERAQNWPRIIEVLKLRVKHFPKDAIAGWLSLGRLYDHEPSLKNPQEALSAFNHAMNITPPERRAETLKKIPLHYHALLVDR